MKVTRHVLKNGIRTVIVEMPGREVVATSVFVGAGGRYEEAEVSGISHFLEHMLLKGTKKYPSKQAVHGFVESVGGSINAGTNDEYVVYYNLIPMRHWARGIQIASEQMCHPLLREDDIEKERGVIIEEINRAYGDPSNFIWRRFRRLAWPDQPIGNDRLGPKENIEKFKRDDFLNHLEKHYVSNNLAICIAGSIRSEEVISELDKRFEHIRRSPRVTPEPIINKQKKSQLFVEYKDIDQAHAFIGYKAFSQYDKRKYAFEVLMTILGSGASSVLSRIIRGEHSLAYTIYGGSTVYSNAGFGYVYAGINKDKVEHAIGLIKKELFKTREILFSEEAIVGAKEYIKGTDVMRLDNTLRVTNYYGWAELFDPEDTPQNNAKLIDRVTAEEIKEVAREVFQDKNENLVVIGPYKSKAKFEEALKNY